MTATATALNRATLLSLVVLLTWALPTAHAQPILDGTFDGPEVWGDPVATNPNAGWEGFNATNLYVTFDDDYVYVGAQSEGLGDWKNYGFLLNIDSETGGAADPWGRQITFAHEDGLPDFVIRGNYDGGWAEFRNWEAGDWTAGGTNVVAEGGVSTNFVEFRIPRGRFGDATSVDVQFFITGNQDAHGTFDAVPADQVADTWEPAEPTVLQNYATASVAEEVERELFAYWNFNNPAATPPIWPQPVSATFGNGTITYNFVEGNVVSFAGTTLNAQFGDPSGGSFVVQAGEDQVNNERYFDINFSTLGFEDIVFAYATRGTSTGFDSQVAEFSVDGGATWTFIGEETDSRETAFFLVEYDLSGFQELNDAESAIIRITVDGSTTASGNNRFDNITLSGVGEAPPPGVSFVQIIHNAPDPAAAEVDVYVDGNLLEEDFAFRSATPFIPLEEGTYQVSITLAGDDEAVIYDESLFVPAGLNIQLIASGVADPDDFPENPDEVDTGFQVLVNTAAATGAPSGQVAVTAVHGSPDAPTVSVAARGVATLFGPFAYTDIEGPLNVASGAFILDVLVGDDTFASFNANLVGGTAVTVLASGFVDAEAGPEGTEAFGLLAVFADGTTAMLAPFEEPEVITIAEARALGVGQTVTIQGTVSRAMGAFTYFQDDTGGFTIRQPSGAFADAVAAGTITTGTQIEATGVISQFRGLLQFNQADLTGWEILDQGEAPEPAEYTLAELQAADIDDIQARLVQVPNLLVDTAAEVFAPATTYFVSDWSIDETFQLRIPNAADTEIDGTPIPPEFFTFTGVVGWFDQPQLLAILEEDIEFQAVGTDGDATPLVFALEQNYPNPFRSSTTIAYSLAEAVSVSIHVYDVTGRRIATLVDGEIEAGSHTATWDASGVASGVYLYRIQAGSFSQTHRALIVR